MDHIEIEERDVVERYLLGRLSTAEGTRFEEHYLDCPECLEKLELTRRLRDGLKDVAAAEGTKIAESAMLAWLARRGRFLSTGLAVALLAVAIMPWAYLAPEVSRLTGEHERLSGQLIQALSPQVRTPAYSLSPERSGPGEEPSTRITLRSTPEWVVLVLQLPPFQSPSPTGQTVGYRVRLSGAGGESLWQSGPLEPDASGPGTGERLTFSVHSTWLEATDYVVELDMLSPGGERQSVAQFAFGVRRGE